MEANISNEQAALAAIESAADGVANHAVDGAESLGVVDVLVYYGWNGKYPVRHAELDCIKVPNIRLMENVNYVKQVLSDFIETCYLTNYSLHKLGFKATDAPLNEFVELVSLYDPTENILQLVLVNDLYDFKKIRVHVNRIWEIINSPPSVTGAEVNSEISENLEQPVETVPAPSSESIFKALSLGSFYDETAFKFKETDSILREVAKAQQLPSKAVKSVALSSWNPPPASRKMQGDLAYIEIVMATEGIFHVTATPKGFYVNQSTRQLFNPLPAAIARFSHNLFNLIDSISASFRNAWNTHYENVILVTSRNLALEAKAAEKQETADGSEQAENASNAASDANKAMSVFAPLASALEQGNLDQISGIPLWNSLQTNCGEDKWSQAKNDPQRMQAFICDSFGVDQNGAPRDWNEEAQSIRMVPVVAEADRISKARYVDRINHEFYEACRTAAVAVVDGNIMPLNPMDPPSSHVYVFNSIFFSRSLDGKETFKVYNGDNAARKAAGQDLKCQQLIQHLEIPELSSVMSCIVDYKGERLIAQTIIPGVLMQGVGAARLMFGAIEFGNRLSVKQDGLNIMKAIGDKFYLGTRNIQAVPIASAKVAVSADADVAGEDVNVQQTSIKTDTEDEVAPLDSDSVPHVGPVEAKLLKGSDGRIYALELMRLTPRDANYVLAESGGTDLIPVETLNLGDKSLRCVYSLRHELIARFIENKVREQRQQILLEAAGNNQEVAVDEKDTNAANSETQIVAKLNAVTAASVASTLHLSPNCFLEVNNESGDPVTLRSDVNPEVASKDEETARQLANFLWTDVIPGFINDVRVGEAIPLDGPSLVDVMHLKGINLRYLGRLAELSLQQEKEDYALASENKQRVHSMPAYFLEIVEIELIARTLKHVLNKVLREDEHSRINPALVISVILNHVLGTYSSAAGTDAAPTGKAQSVAGDHCTQTDKKKKKKKTKGGMGTESIDSAVVEALDISASVAKSFSRAKVLSVVKSEAMARFLHSPALLKLEDAVEAPTTESDPMQYLASLRLSKLALLRRVCVLTGIRIACRDYDFSVERPITVDDIVAIVPIAISSSGISDVVKDEFSNPIVRNIVTASQKLIGDGALLHAFEVAQEAHNISQQISGAASKEILMSLEQIANVLMAAGDLHQSLNTSLRVLAMTAHMSGFDSLDTLQQHGRIASVLMAYRKSLAASGVANAGALSSLSYAALHHLCTCKYIIELNCGVRHTALVDIFRKMATIFGELEEYSLALSCLLDAKRRSCDLTVQASIGQSIAEILFSMGLFAQALQEQRQCFKLISEIFGADDDRSTESKGLVEKYLRATTEKNVKVYRQMQLQAAQEIALAASADSMNKQVAISEASTDKKKPHQSQNHKKKGGKK